MMPRGRAWSPQEIRCLLALIRGSREVTLLMASTSRPNETLWREISGQLAAAGYSRNVAQCRSKWKALKQAFYSEWETRRQAGGHTLRMPPHYRAMKRIWKEAGKPVFGERRLPDLGKQLSQQKGHHPGARGPPVASAGPPDSVIPSSLEPLAGNPEPSVPMRVQAPPEATEVEEAGVGEQPLGPDGQEPSLVSLLLSMQQILVQILRTSQQQQLLLESLASDTVSHLHAISDNLVQVGETLQELLLQGSTINLADPYGIHTPPYEAIPQPCSPSLAPALRKKP